MLQPIQAGSPSAVAGSTARPSAEASTKPVPNAAHVAAFAQVDRTPGRAELGNVVADLNKVAQANAQGVRFSVDEESGRTVVKVVDTQTDTVLRQIPSVEALKLWRSIEQMQGVMLRDKA
jgi:flagellar protein FlaG